MQSTSEPSAGSGDMRKSLIPKSLAQHTFDVVSNNPYIVCVDQGIAWVRTDESTLQLMDKGGSVKDTINVDFVICGMALTSNGEILLLDSHSSCVKTLSRQKTICNLLRTNWEATGLCCLRNDDVVVTCKGGKGNVTVYTRTGAIRQKLDHIKFRCPIRVAVNKVNHDIYIRDYERNDWISPGKVIVLGPDFQPRYEYCGQGDKEFSPLSICTDHSGHVLITDYSNHRVYILDQKGRFMQYILTSEQGLHLPRTIDVDVEGYVWVGEDLLNKGRVTVARYLQ